MQVTNIEVNNLSPKESGICGEFTITLDHSLCIHKVLVIQGEKGLFIAFPNSGEAKCSTGAKKYRDIVHPTNNTLRQHIQSEVLKRYNEEVDGI